MYVENGTEAFNRYFTVICIEGLRLEIPVYRTSVFMLADMLKKKILDIKDLKPPVLCKFDPFVPQFICYFY